MTLLRPNSGRSHSLRPMQRAAVNVDSSQAQDLGRRLSDIKIEIAKSEGRRDVLQNRLEALTDDVGRAKGRVSKKPEVDDFLESLQADLHKKAVGSYETLLSALAQDVLKQDIKIGLDLYTDRGLPALDIFVDKGDGRRVDIIEGTGGSLTNIVSMGLRMISAVRSGGRKFVALDEPDCWIKPFMVPHFNRVIDDLAKNLNVQSLLITHHAEDMMPEGFSIARVYVDNGKLVCANDQNLPAWEEGQEGIRRIRMQNFQSHSDTEIMLSPKTTVIVGDNNIGKSVVVRAIRALAYGEFKDDYLKHGEKALCVEVEIEGGRVVKLTRQPGRNPINEWTLEDGSGNIVVDADTNTEYRTGGGRSGAPEWVSKVLGIEKFEGLDHQISHQKFPVFLLGETASKRASVLSIGRESSYVQKMIARQRETAKADAKTIKEGEKEVAKIMEELQKLEVFKDLAEKVESLTEDEIKIGERNQLISELKGMEGEFATIHQRRARIEPKIQALSKIPDWVGRVEASIQRREEINDLGKRMISVQNGIQRAEKVGDALKNGLPKIPVLSDATESEKLSKDILNVQEKITGNTARTKGIVENLEGVKKDIESTLSETGNICPLCNSQVEHSHSIV